MKNVNMFLNVLFENLKDEYIEVRLLSKNKKPKTRFYSSVEELLKDFGSFSEEKGYDCYFGICPRRNKQQGKKAGNKEAVSRISVLWADIDAKSFAGGKEEALNRLHAFALPPSIVIDSGNGFHAYWKLQESTTDKEKVEAYLRGLSQSLGADSSNCEVARIFRLPETTNNKNPNNPLPVQLIHLISNKYALGDFDFVLSGDEKKVQIKNSDGWIAEALANLEEGNRNTTFAKIVGRLHKDGHSSETILVILAPHAEKCGFSLNELQREIQGICSRYDGSDCEGKKNIVQEMMAFIEEYDLCLFQDQYNDPYVILPEFKNSAVAVASKVFKSWLKALAWVKLRIGLTNEKIQAITGILEGKALCEKAVRNLHIRSAKQDSAIYYDLGKSRIVCITAEGWTVLKDAPVTFRRSKSQHPQPDPAADGDVRKFLEFVNLPDGDDGKHLGLLALVWLVASFIPDFPHPVLVVYGPHGSAKSTFFSLLKQIIDPSPIRRLAPPVQHLDLIVTSSKHWFLPYDNLSVVSEWLSDAFCRICTGDGFSKRELYTDSEEVILTFQRILGINGINLVIDKPDLLDRSLLVELHPIPKNKRRTEDEINQSFALVRASILGGVFNVLVLALREYPKVEISQLPRMADFMKWGVAIAKALGFTEQEFFEAYEANIANQVEEAIHANPVAEAIISFMETEEYWEGSAQALLDELNHVAMKNNLNTKSKIWPQDTNWLWKRLNLAKNNLLAKGIAIERGTTGKVRYITITKIS